MHNKVIRRCIDLGRSSKGFVKTNPLVGAVFIHENKIVGEGAHIKYGEAHAEVNALRGINAEVKRKGTLYVSLEPCFHQGKTPACLKLILDERLTNVVIACEDPNPQVAGKSIKALQNAGVHVITNILKEEGEQLIRPFAISMAKKRPYIILKYAQSNDGYIGHPERQIWLTNTFSKHLVHKWRSECDAILVGTNTALLDNPDLTNRLYFGKKENVRILLDKDLKTPRNHNVFDNNSLTWILTKKEIPKEDNVTYFTSNFDENHLADFMCDIYQRQIGTLIIEGGAKVLQSFIDANLWDEARVFHSPKTIGEGGIAAPILKDANLQSTHQILDDVLKVYYRKEF
jgi:diaminohydroxyphosphoribosylaminopyrimidine deaminase / 5-amino-6-(5-phosphoribosylamino)uracil reductase